MKPTSMCILTLLLPLALLLGCDSDSSRLPTAPEVAAHRVRSGTPQFSDWSAPVNLGPVVNSDSADIEVAISRDGLSLYFASNRPGGYGRQDIWVSRRASPAHPWGSPQNLGPTINTEFDDRAPALTRNGHRMYFASDRPGVGNFDLYVARRRDQRDDFGWQAPETLGASVNTLFNENLPHYFEDAETGAGTLYFNSNRSSGVPGTGNNDIYASARQRDGTFSPALLVLELSSPLRDAKVAIRRDGLELFLTSDRIGTLGTFDVWVATRATTSDAWSTPLNLGPLVNTASDEGRIALSFDATALYVTGTRPGGIGVRQDIWVSTRSRLAHDDDDDDDDEGDGDDDDDRRRHGRR